MNKCMLYNGDCLDILDTVEEKAVLIFADLPYGTTQNHWDKPLDLNVLWKKLLKIGLITTSYVFTAQIPFSILLGYSNLPMLKYELIWDKVRTTGHLNAKRMPLKQHENILVFYKRLGVYNPQMSLGGKPYKGIKTSYSKNYGKEVAIVRDNNGERYPTSIKTIYKDNKHTLHTTEKPLELMEYLVNTYTNEGDLVLDPTMGSGSTGVAALKLNRRFIGIEKDKDIFALAKQRIKQYE